MLIIDCLLKICFEVIPLSVTVSAITSIPVGNMYVCCSTIDGTNGLRVSEEKALELL